MRLSPLVLGRDPGIPVGRQPTGPSIGWAPLLVLPALLMLGTPGVATNFARAQDKPDRPPWAQKSKGDSTPKTPAASDDDGQEAGSQRGRIRVNVNLVNVLVSQAASTQEKLLRSQSSWFCVVHLPTLLLIFRSLL